MGRAEILENKGEGLYRVQYKYGTEAIAREQLLIHNQVIQFDHDLVELTDKIADLGTEFTAANVALQAVLAEPDQTTKEWSTRLSEKLKALNVIGIDLKQAEAAKVLTQLQKEEAIARSLRLSALPEFEERDLWVADYSAEIQPTGADIPTIEVAGEAHGENWALLYPANNEAPPAFDQVMHGERTHAAGMAPAACFVAWAMLPGWQKYRPSYRVGKILIMRDDGLAKVELQVPLTSSEQNLLIPPSDPMAESVIFERQTHERVPFAYMDCDNVAFKVGDEVLIKYTNQDSTQPVIIGFAHNPEPCSAISVFTAAKERLRYSRRDKGRWVSVKSPIVPRFGSCYWTGDGGAVSWVGWRARYFQARRTSVFPQFPDPDEGFTSTAIYYRGVNYGPCPGVVLGGCVRKKYLFVICRIGTREVLCVCPLAGKREWTEIAGVDAGTWAVLTPWYFSQTGGRAASAKYVLDLGGSTVATQTVELQMPTDKVVPPFSASFRVLGKVPVTVTDPSFPSGSTPTGGTDTVEHGFAVDYVGETLVSLDRRTETREYVVFGPPDTLATEWRVWVLCSVLNLEIEDYHTTSKQTDDRLVWAHTTPANIDHLNVTGGLGKVVSVTRRIDGTAVTVGIGSGTTTVTATQAVTLTSGIDKLNMLPLTETASYSFSPSGSAATDAFYKLISLFQIPYSSLFPVSYTVATRTGHLVTSLPLVGLGRAMPPLPVSSLLRSHGGDPIGAG